jgi:hypothetical protein
MTLNPIAGINGDVWLSTSPPTALGSPESCTDFGDHIHYNAATHAAWDFTKTLTIQKSTDSGSTWNTVTNYSFWYPLGVIVFNTANGSTDLVRISAGSYFTLTSLAGAHSWKSTGKADTKETTGFQAVGGWATYIATVKSLTATISCFSVDTRVLNEMAGGGLNTSNGIVLCQLWANEATGFRWQFYALPTKTDATVMVTDVEKQDVDFQSVGPVYLLTSNSYSTATIINM